MFIFTDFFEPFFPVFSSLAQPLHPRATPQTVHLTPPPVMMQRDSLGQFTSGSADGGAGSGNDTDGSVSSSGGKSARAEQAMAAVEGAAAAASAAPGARRAAVAQLGMQAAGGAAGGTQVEGSRGGAKIKSCFGFKDCSGGTSRQ